MQRAVFGVVALIVLIGCAMDPSDIPTLEVGQEFTDSDINILVIDTLDLELKTIKFDSINTSESNRLLFGRYNDELLGQVEATSFLELTAPGGDSQNGTLNLDSESSLDSVVLVLGYDQYFLNDTTSQLQMNVHLLNEKVGKKNVYYNTSLLDFNATPLTQYLFIPKPLGKDSLQIRLPDSFAQPLFDQIIENQINDNDDLLEYFPGLVLQASPVDSGGSVIGFSRDQEETYIRIYYSIPDEFDDDEDFLDLTISAISENATAFHRVSLNPDREEWAGILDQEDEIQSIDTDDLTVIQAGTGYATKVVIPNITSLNELRGTGTILSAILQIKPLVGSINKFHPLRDTLNIAIVDVNNEIIEEIRTGFGLVEGVIKGEEEEFESITYEIPIGVFLDQKLSEQPRTENGLILFNENYNSTVNRLILQGEQNEDFRAKIILTYAIYAE